MTRHPAVRRASSAAAVTCALTLLAGCGNGDDGPPAAGIGGKVTVLAAASLTESFTVLGHRFESRHPGATVAFSFAASSELASQIAHGAPADVFAPASTATMTQVSDASDTAGKPRVFARNVLEIAVPADNPGEVRGLDDLARPELVIALCAPEVPCGAAASKAFQVAGITPRPDTLEADVKATLAKVLLGEVDAALVYRTDVRAAGGKVRGIDFPEAAQAVNDYPIAVLADAADPATARAFVRLVRSATGDRVLARAGFLSP